MVDTTHKHGDFIWGGRRLQATNSCYKPWVLSRYSYDYQWWQKTHGYVMICSPTERQLVWGLAYAYDRTSGQHLSAAEVYTYNMLLTPGFA
jgi:hypothetical protein